MFRSLRRHFTGSTLLALVGFALAAGYGWHDSHSWPATLAVLWAVMVLAVLEISLSFDNAVVNAAVLTEMEPIWQRRFLTWGMIFAVFGTRIAFPLAIVGLVAGLGPVDAVRLSLEEPARYEAIVAHAHIAIAGFGGTFLALVGLNFFIDAEKDSHWLGWPEQGLKRLARIRGGAIGLLLAVLLVIGRLLAPADAMQFMVSGLIGMIAFIAVDALAGAMADGAARRAMTGAVARTGFGAFVYLNILDASFSLDGVIGAFALTRNMVLIAIGLSIGAMFVRSLTMMMVSHSTLAAYRYLEHGAFWAIIALGAIMLVSALIEVPQTVTGLIGAALIGAALWSSITKPG